MNSNNQQAFNINNNNQINLMNNQRLFNFGNQQPIDVNNNNNRSTFSFGNQQPIDINNNNNRSTFSFGSQSNGVTILKPKSSITFIGNISFNEFSIMDSIVDTKSEFNCDILNKINKIIKGYYEFVLLSLITRLCDNISLGRSIGTTESIIENQLKLVCGIENSSAFIKNCCSNDYISLINQLMSLGGNLKYFQENANKSSIADLVRLVCSPKSMQYNSTINTIVKSIFIDNIIVRNGLHRYLFNNKIHIESEVEIMQKNQLLYNKVLDSYVGGIRVGVIISTIPSNNGLKDSLESSYVIVFGDVVLCWNSIGFILPKSIYEQYVVWINPIRIESKITMNMLQSVAKLIVKYNRDYKHCVSSKSEFEKTSVDFVDDVLKTIGVKPMNLMNNSLLSKNILYNSKRSVITNNMQYWDHCGITHSFDNNHTAYMDIFNSTKELFSRKNSTSGTGSIDVEEYYVILSGIENALKLNRFLNRCEIKVHAKSIFNICTESPPIGIFYSVTPNKDILDHNPMHTVISKLEKTAEIVNPIPFNESVSNLLSKFDYKVSKPCFYGGYEYKMVGFTIPTYHNIIPFDKPGLNNESISTTNQLNGGLSGVTNQISTLNINGQSISSNNNVIVGNSPISIIKMFVDSIYNKCYNSQVTLSENQLKVIKAQSIGVLWNIYKTKKTNLSLLDSKFGTIIESYFTKEFAKSTNGRLSKLSINYSGELFIYCDFSEASVDPNTDNIINTFVSSPSSKKKVATKKHNSPKSIGNKISFNNSIKKEEVDEEILSIKKENNGDDDEMQCN